MAKVNIKQQILSITILIGIFGVVIAVAIIIPSIKEILSLEHSITETQKFLEQQYEKTQKMRRSVHSLETVTKQTEKFNKTTIAEGGELYIITELEKIASANNIEQNLRVDKVNPNEQKGPITDEQKKLPTVLRKRSYYTFSFSNSGDFKNHLQYIKNLEQLPYYLTIDNMQFDKKTNSDAIDLRFNAKIYITEE